MSNVQRRCATFESSSGHRDISDYHAFLRFAKHEPTDNRVCKQTDVTHCAATGANVKTIYQNNDLKQFFYLVNNSSRMLCNASSHRNQSFLDLVSSFPWTLKPACIYLLVSAKEQMNKWTNLWWTIGLPAIGHPHQLPPWATGIHNTT